MTDADPGLARGGGPIRVALLDDYQAVALRCADWSPLAATAELVAFDDHIEDEDALAARLASFDVVVAMRERTAFTASLLDRLPGLRLLVTTGGRNASIDLPAARRNGVTVCGTRSSGSAAAELTWALLLALMRKIPAEDAAVRSGGWQSTVGVDLAGRTIGLLGLGRIGSRVARYACAFDMHVLAWSQNLDRARADECGARLVGSSELFDSSDIVSVHLRLSERTRGVIGADELARLGSRGYLVNTSRGPLVDEPALVRALRAGVIAGAALDVFDREPLPPDHPLRDLPNTVVTPHIGYVTAQGYDMFYGDVVEDILAWLDGAPVRVLAHEAR